MENDLTKRALLAGLLCWAMLPASSTPPPPPPPPGRLPVGSTCVAASQQACAQVGAQYGTKYACVSCHAVFGKWGGYQKHVGGAPLTIIVAGVAADGSQIFGTCTGGAPLPMAVPGSAPVSAGGAQGKAERADAQGRAFQAKAIKRACQADDVHALLTDPTLGAVLDGRADLAGRVTATLVRHGRLAEAASLLSLPGVCLDAAGLRDALLLMPQTEPISAANAVAFVAAAARPLLRAAFLSRQMCGLLLEFVAEAEAARARGASERRIGKATMVCVSAGQKPGELLCSGNGGGGVDERRGMLAGDCVALTAPSPYGGFVGCSASSGGSMTTGGYCNSGSYCTDGYNNDGYNNGAYSNCGHGNGGYGNGGCNGGCNGVSGCNDGVISSGCNGAGGGVGGNCLLLEAEIISGMPLVLKLCGAGGGAGDGASATAEAYAARLVARGATVRLDKLGNRIAYKRQLQAFFTVHGAVERVRAEVSGLPPPPLLKERTRAEPSGHIAAALTATANGGSVESLCALAAAAVQPAAAAYLPEPHRLNESQLAAATAAATQALTLVQGPPGTGKTKVALAVLVAWVQAGRSGGSELVGRAAGGQVLASSDSNIAVDNLLEGLVRAGVHVVRLGRPDSVRPELLRYCVEAACSQPGGSRSEEMAARQRMLKQAEVVCATCVGVGSEQLKPLSFPCVLIDEATQATEASALVALCRGARQVALLGDQHQLPPTTVARHPEALTASIPLFTRLLGEGVPALLLDTQYRMHPVIAQLPADLFYGGRLASGVTAEQRPAAAGFPWPQPCWPVALLPA